MNTHELPPLGACVRITAGHPPGSPHALDDVGVTGFVTKLDPHDCRLPIRVTYGPTARDFIWCFDVEPICIDPYEPAYCEGQPLHTCEGPLA